MKTKLLIVGTLGALMLTSCGTTVDTSKSSDEVLSAARNNFVTEMQETIKDRAEGSSSGTLSGKVSSTSADMPLEATFSFGNNSKVKSTEDSQEAMADVMINADVTKSPFGPLKANGELKLISAAKNIYLQLTSLDATSDDATMSANITPLLTQIKPFLEDWYQISLDQLEALNPNGGARVNNLTLSDLQKLLDSIKDTKIFTVKDTLPAENGMYVYKVGLEADGALAMIEQFLAISNAPATLTDDDKNQVKAAITALNNSPLELTLYVDAGSMRYAKLTAKGSFTAENNASIDVDSSLESSAKGKSKIAAKVTGKQDDKEMMNLNLDLNIDGTKEKGTMDLTITDLLTFHLDIDGDFKKENVTIDLPQNPINALEYFQSLTAPQAGTTDTDSQASNSNTNVAAQ